MVLGRAMLPKSFCLPAGRHARSIEAEFTVYRTAPTIPMASFYDELFPQLKLPMTAKTFDSIRLSLLE